MPRLACLCFAFITAAGAVANAQGLYLPSQQSGIGVAAAVSNNSDATTVSLGAGYSHKAFIDAGIFVHRYGFSTDQASVSAIGVQPYAMVHLLRQSDKVPVALSALGNFQKYFYQSDDEARDIDGYSFFLGGSAHRRFGASETVSITPQVILGHIFTRTSGGVGLIRLDPYANSFAIQLASHIGYQAVGSATVWTLTPYMNIDSTYVTFGATVGATFPVGKK